MKAFLIWALLLVPLASSAQEVEADPAQDEAAETTPELIRSGVDVLSLDEFLWVNRLVIVFADSERDPRFIKQMEMLSITPEDLETRDVVVLIDTEPDVDSALRERFHPRDFQLLLLGKDGEIKLRKPSPWSVRELVRAIDKLPLRQEEIGRR